MAASSLFAVFLGGYVTYVYTSYRRGLEDYYGSETATVRPDQDVSNRYNDWSRDYDGEVEWAEWCMGMGRRRKRLVQDDRVRGSVLEVGVGTGRNLKWYVLSERDEGDENKKKEDITTRQQQRGRGGSRGRESDGGVQTLTLVDQSPQMLGVARRKWEDMFDPTASTRESKRKTPTQRARWMSSSDRVHWITGDVTIKGVVSRPAHGFDAVVQTMGLCSYADPVGALKQLGQLVRQPGEGISSSSSSSATAVAEVDDPGGTIHLLEHGRTPFWPWLNRFLDRTAPLHAHRYGCWWNRDIPDIVRRSGLRVESVRTYHLGTTWEFVLRPTIP